MKALNTYKILDRYNENTFLFEYENIDIKVDADVTTELKKEILNSYQGYDQVSYNIEVQTIEINEILFLTEQNKATFRPTTDQRQFFINEICNLIESGVSRYTNEPYKRKL